MQTIGQNIHDARKKAGYTQDILANMLGVSAGAVSKWERGHSYPDITLLAPLARSLHISLDILLSYQISLRVEDVHKIKQQMIEHFISDGYEKTENSIQDILHEYPLDMYLKLAMVSVLFMHLPYIGDDEHKIKEKIIVMKTIVKEVLSSNASELHQQASYIYVMLAMELEEYDECEEMLVQMKSSSIDIQSLFLNLYTAQQKHNEMETIAQQILLDGLSKMTSALTIMAKVSENDQTLKYLHDCDALYETYQFSYHQSKLCLTKYFIQMKQYDQAAHAYLKYIESIISFPNHHEQHPYLYKVKLEYNEISQKHMRMKMLEMELADQSYQLLYPYPTYLQAKQKIQDYLKENT